MKTAIIYYPCRCAECMRRIQAAEKATDHRRQTIRNWCIILSAVIISYLMLYLRLTR